MKSRFPFAPGDNRCLQNAGCRLLLVICAGLGFPAAAQTVNLITPHDVSLVVKNGTVSNKTDFHLIFIGDLVSPPPVVVLPAQRATSSGTILGAWTTNAPTLAYDSTNNLTMVCWEDTNNPVAPGEHIRVGVQDPVLGELEILDEYWTPTSTVPAAAERVPARQVSLLHTQGSSGVTLLVTAPNPNAPTQSVTLVSMQSAAPVTLANLTPQNPAVTGLVATSHGSYTLAPTQTLTITVTLQAMPGTAPLPVLILRSDATASGNSNSTIQLDQLILDPPTEDTTCLTNCPGSGVFMTVNPPGPNSVFQWYKDGQPMPGATNTTLLLTNLVGLSEGIYTGLATNATSVKRKFFKLFIVDNTPPRLNCPSNLVVECTGNGGAVVNYSVSASDNCGGPVQLECEPPPGSFFPLGTTVVSCIARDTFQNPAVCTFTVTVRDSTPPEISCLSDRVFTAPSPIIFNFSIGVFDNCDTNVTVQCDPPSGSTFFHGTTTVTCTARDASGNTSQCSFNVTLNRPGGSKLNGGLSNGLATVTWSNSSALLQRAPQVTGPWVTLSNATSPYLRTPSQPQEYFRLFFPDAIPQMQSAFINSDPVGANFAYAQFYLLGADGINPLMQMTGVTSPYAGSAYQNPRSSRTPTNPPSVRLMTVYLVDGILLGNPTPHYSPTLISTNPATPQQKEQQAVTLYNLWWNTNQGKTLPQLQAAPNPLTGSALRWNGPLLFDQSAPAEGNERTNSSTPVYPHTNNPCLRNVDGADPGTNVDSYAWEYRPRDLGGPSPYNCLAWAINCYTNRWLDTPTDTTNVWEQVLTDHGYNVAGGPVSCVGQCPGNSGPKFKIIFHVKPGETPSDANWVHAMKQEADVQWTSKNGQGPLFENITDEEKFLDKHYPVPAGQMRVERCYCK